MVSAPEGRALHPRLGRPARLLARFHADHDARRGPWVASARGYVGNGVATTNLSGRVLADLITGVKSEITTLPCVNHRSQNWESEPFRYLGVTISSTPIGEIDQKAERTGVAPSGKTLAERLTRH